jgi:hypothetical protein
VSIPTPPYTRPRRRSGPQDAFSWTRLRVRQSFIARGLNDDRIAAGLRTEYARLHRRLADAVEREQTGGAIDGGVDEPYR